MRIVIKIKKMKKYVFWVQVWFPCLLFVIITKDYEVCVASNDLLKGKEVKIFQWKIVVV